MRRPTHPPEMAFFNTPRPPAGPRAAALRLGPLEIEIAGIDDALAALLEERWGPYFAAPGAKDRLRVALRSEATDYFIDPPPLAETVPVRLACDGDRVRYVSYRVAGWFGVEPGAEGLLLLADGEREREPDRRALENYVRAAVAWQAASRGGCLVHAASAVWNGEGYLFYGESGAGKSTLSECNRRARIVSDDLSLLLPGPDGRLQLVGSPFRGTYEEGAPVVGSFPLRAGFRLIQAAEAAVRPVPRVRALSEMVGNLPFVAEAFDRRPDLFDRIESAFRPVPLAHLHFRKDDSYWDAIAGADLRR